MRQLTNTERQQASGYFGPLSTVYLAGPITGLDYDGATNWRVSAARMLESAGIKPLDPMRGKEALKDAGILDCYGYDNMMTTCKAVMARDRFDCNRCDVLFVNLLGTTRVSIGTCMEIAWAHIKKTPIVCCIEPDNIHQHAMLSEALDFQARTLAEGIAIIKAILE